MGWIIVVIRPPSLYSVLLSLRLHAWRDLGIQLEQSFACSTCILSLVHHMLFFVLFDRSASFSSYSEMLHTGYLTNNVFLPIRRFLSRICKKKKLVRYEEKKCILSIVLFLFVFWNEMKNRNEIEMNKMAWLLFLRMIRKLFLLILMTPFWEIECYLKKDS